MPHYGTSATAAALDLQRQRERDANRIAQMELAAKYQELADQRQALEAARRRRAEEAQDKRRIRAQQRVAAPATGGRPYTQFTPPQSFISGGAASHISGAPALLDVFLVATAAALSGAWVVTRDQNTGADLGWAIFLELLGVGLSVEGHAELHDVGVGLLGAQSAYLAIRLLGGTTQP